MNREQCQRRLFVSAACLFSLPWLTPCTFGIGTVASSAINRAALPLAAGPLDYLPYPDLKQWAARPGPWLEVQTGKSIALTQFIHDDELPKNAADGTFFGIAQRIHFRSGTTEVILEGDVTVQSGEQHIKGMKPDAIMRLDFKNRRVIVNGPVVEKKLFR